MIDMDFECMVSGGHIDLDHDRHDSKIVEYALSIGGIPTTVSGRTCNHGR